MENKVITKNWDITKVSKEFNPVQLLENWRKTKLNEISLRTNAFKNKDNFKKWWFVFLKAESLLMKVTIQLREYKNYKKPTDEQKDFIDEADKIDRELKKHYEKVPKVTKLMNKNRKKVLSFLASDKELKKYKVKISIDFLNNEGHDISDEDIKARDATWGIGVLDLLWEALEKDKVYSPIRDDEGKVIKEIVSWRDGSQSWDPKIRQKMFESWYSWDRKHRDTYFCLCKYLAARLNQNAEYYKYKTWIEQSVNNLYQLDIKDYYSIIDYTDKFKSSTLEYEAYDKSLICKAYGLKQFEPWDTDLVIKNTNDSITQVQAKQKILEALSCLGPEYINRVKKCFDSDIIYWSKENRKLTGYCFSGTSLIDEHPIYFNWDGTSKAAATLAHELGHNIAAEYIKENNEIDKEHNDMFSEIPSIVNSVLFHLYWIKSLKDKKAPKNQLYGAYRNILDYLHETITDTGYCLQLGDRVTQKFNKDDDWKPEDFEIFALGLERFWHGMTAAEYKKRRTKCPYILQNLCAYRTFINICLQQNVNITYYLGSIVALAIAPKIMAGDKQTLAKYMKFLKTGESLNPIKTFKDVMGIDLTKPQVYTEAKHQLEKLIKEFKHDIKI